MNSSYLPRRTAFLPPPPRPINGIYPKKEMEEWSKNNRKIIKKNFKKKPDDYDLDIFCPSSPTFDKNEIIENKNREIKWLYYRRDFWKKKTKTFKNFLIASFCCSGVGLFLILYSLFEFLRQ